MASTQCGVRAPTPYWTVLVAVGSRCCCGSPAHIRIAARHRTAAVSGGVALLAWAVPKIAFHLRDLAVKGAWLRVLNPLVLSTSFQVRTTTLMVGLVVAGLLWHWAAPDPRRHPDHSAAA